MNLMINRARGQSGQAMVEFLVAAMFFLVPLFLAIAAVGKFIDVQHTNDMAARYAAWERTVWYDDDIGKKFYTSNHANQKSSAEINSEIAARVLNDRSTTATVIKDADKTATSFINGIDPMWRDPAGTVYLRDYSQLTVTVTKEAPKKDIAGGVLGLLSSVGVMDDAIGSLVPPVQTDTLAIANVTFNKVAKSSGAYQRLWLSTPVWTGVDFESTGAILSNTWYANSAVGTKAMVAESTPTAKYFGKALKAGAIAGIVTWDPMAIVGIDVGKISVDEIPSDRLK